MINQKQDVTKEELEALIQESRIVDNDREYSSDGSFYGYNIYMLPDGTFFRVKTYGSEAGEHYCVKYDRNAGYIHGVHTIEQVVKKYAVVKTQYWVSEADIQFDIDEGRTRIESKVFVAYFDDGEKSYPVCVCGEYDLALNEGRKMVGEKDAYFISVKETPTK